MDKRFTITFSAQYSGVLLREAIASYGISKRALTAIKFNGGEISVNGKEQNVRYILQEGDVVQIKFPLEDVSEGLKPEYNPPFEIIYEDDYLLVLNKPPMVSTIPSREHPTGSVANFLIGYYEQKNIQSTVHVVTRLDRDTSGLMCIAKHRHIHHLMSEQQKNGGVHREYEAIVHGHLQQDSLSIIEPIGRKETSIIEREVRDDGQFAHTDLTVLKRFKYGGQLMTHIRIKLYTGRTHQIRVHCSHIGHPLVGDELYGGGREYLPYQALQCRSLSFVHPIEQKPMHFTCPLREQFRNLIQGKRCST